MALFFSLSLNLRRQKKKSYISHCILPGSENERNTILLQGYAQNRRTGGGGRGRSFQNYCFTCASELKGHVQELSR